MSSTISKTAQIAPTAVIHDGVVIEDHVIIHDYVVVYPGVTIKEGCEIFDHCVIGKYPTSPGCTERPLKEDYTPVTIGEHCVLCNIVEPNGIKYVLFSNVERFKT